MPIVKLSEGNSKFHFSKYKELPPNLFISLTKDGPWIVWMCSASGRCFWLHDIWSDIFRQNYNVLCNWWICLQVTVNTMARGACSHRWLLDPAVPGLLLLLRQHDDLPHFLHEVMIITGPFLLWVTMFLMMIPMTLIYRNKGILTLGGVSNKHITNPANVTNKQF